MIIRVRKYTKEIFLFVILFYENAFIQNDENILANHIKFIKCKIYIIMLI